MTSAVLARRLGQLVTLVVLVSSGTYLLVYLYRWEWNRAVVAGIFFVATEVAIAATAILRRLRALEARLDTTLPAAGSSTMLARIQEAAPEPAKPFAWLDDRAQSMNVFVPVLLGAGVVLSVLAAAVERLASATAVPTLERSLASRLGSLALPEGGLLGTSAGTPRITQIDHRPPPRRLDRLALRGFAVLAAGLLLVAAIDVLADETQDRPDPKVPGSMAVTIEVDRRFTSRNLALTGEALFVACRHTVGDRSRASLVEQGRPGVVMLVISPAFGEHAQRRLVGCLEDATFDRVSARVLAVDQVGERTP